MSGELLRVEHLKQYFPINAGFGRTVPLKAVDDVSFTIGQGETLGARFCSFTPRPPGA